MCYSKVSDAGEAVRPTQHIAIFDTHMCQANLPLPVGIMHIEVKYFQQGLA